MNNIKKCILCFCFILILVVVCSLSAFAYDLGDTFDFQLSSFPVHTLTNSDTQQCLSYFIQNANHEVLYIEMICTRGNNNAWNFTSSGYLSLTAGSYFDTTVNSGYDFLPILTNSVARPGYSINCPISIYVYEVDGDLVFSSTTGGIGGSMATANAYSYGTNWYFNGTDASRFYRMLNSNDFFPLVAPSTFLRGNDWITTNLPSNLPDVLLGYYDVDQPTNMGECTIDATILVNGQEIYSSSGSTPSASVISGSASGSVPDGQGGSQDVNFDINLEIPEYDGEIGVGEFPTMPQFDDSALSVMDGGSALQWVYNKLQYFYSNQQKIALLLTSCLSLGVVMLILNKRS